MIVDERLARAKRGTRIGPTPLELSANWNAKLVAGSGSSVPRGRDADPLLAGQLALGVYAACVPGPMIHVMQRTRHHAPVPVDVTVECGGVVADRYAKRGRPYVEIDFAVSHDGNTTWEGTILCTNPNTSCDGLDERAGSSAPQAGQPSPELASLDHAFDLDAMTLYSGPGNIHSDLAVARSVGLDQPVVQGMQVASLCARLLGERWDAEWSSRGEWEVLFVGMAWAEESLHASLHRSSQGGNEDPLDLRVVKADGTICLVGKASLT